MMNCSNLCLRLYEIVPDVLKASGESPKSVAKRGRAAAFTPALWHKEEKLLYPSCLAISRSIGCLSQLILSRAHGYPIERPKSVTSACLEEKFK